MGQEHDYDSPGANGISGDPNGGPVGSSFAEWLGQPARNVTLLALFLLLIICFGLMALGLSRQSSRITTDERTTCNVQHHGLPADRALLKVITDEHAAAAFSGAIKIRTKLSPFEKRVLLAELHIEGITPATLRKAHELDVKTATDTDTYRKLELKVPPSRHC